IRTTGLTCISQALQLADSLVKDTELTAITLHSDGYANDPSANGEAKTIEGLIGGWQDRPVFVNTIAYSDYSDFRLLSKVANAASGTCIKTGNIREVYDALNNTAKLLGGQITPPIEVPLPKGAEFQVFLSRSGGKINGSAEALHLRGLKPEDDAGLYRYRALSKAEWDKQKDAPVMQTSEP